MILNSFIFNLTSNCPTYIIFSNTNLRSPPLFKHHVTMSAISSPTLSTSELQVTTGPMIEAVYPAILLRPTRANVARIVRDGLLNTVTYQWRRCPEPTDEERVRMRARADIECRKHFVVFCSMRCVVAMLHETFPHVDPSSTLMRELREYSMRTVGANLLADFKSSCYVSFAFKSHCCRRHKRICS